MTIAKMTPGEIHEAISSREGAINMHREAVKNGITFGRLLELHDPSPEGAKLDAFGRQLKQAGIILRSNPAQGYYASEGEKFFSSYAGRALFQEFFAREWRSIAFGSPQKRAILLSGDSIPGSWDRPWAEASSAVWNNQIEPAIPLSEIVAMTNPISGSHYKSAYMTYDAEQLRMFRVGESAEIPMATLTSSERTIDLRKYGRGLRSSYEQLRRMRIDRIAWWIRWMAVQSETDKIAAALDVLVNGDGNANTGATEYNMIGDGLDVDGVLGELSLKAWLAFRMKFENPYVMTTVLSQVDEALQLILLNSGSANVPLAGLNLAGIGNSLTPINSTADGIRYGWLTEAPDQKYVGFDKRFALEHLMEIGSEITETERFITNQTEVLVMSEISGFAVLDPAAAKILDIAN